MRGVLYEGIAHNLCQVSIFAGEHADERVQSEAFAKLTRSLDFSGEDYIQYNLDAFVRIPEHRNAKDMYDLLHRIVDEGRGDMNNNCQRLMWMLGYYIQEDQLPARNFRKYLTKNRADSIITQARKIYSQAIKSWEGFQRQSGLNT